jgi:tRNA-dihydrouridine synthase B
MNIGNLEIEYKAVPAPLASLTDIAFRKLLDEIGYTGFMVTEMISAEGLRRQQTKTLDMIRTVGFKTPQFVQLFGSQPEPFVEAVKYIENETDFCGIDVNMGCPANKVVKKGGGGALLKNPAMVAAIVREIKKNTNLPVTVKIRLGFAKENVLENVKILEQEGADAITVHFRLCTDGYSGEARWHSAPLIKETLKKDTVFIGNGDIKTAAQAREKMKIVSGVMIGRGAMANPLIFAEIAGALKKRGKKGTGKENNENLNMNRVCHRLLDLIEDYYAPEFRLARIKAFSRFLFSNRKNSKKFRQKIYGSTTFEEARDYFELTRANNYFTD